MTDTTTITKAIYDLSIRGNTHSVIVWLFILLFLVFALPNILKFIVSLIELYNKQKTEKAKKNTEETNGKSAYEKLNKNLEIKEKVLEIKEKEIELKSKDFHIIKQKLSIKALNIKDDTIKKELDDMISLIKD